jgi:hypothetical protein
MPHPPGVAGPVNGNLLSKDQIEALFKKCKDLHPTTSSAGGLGSTTGAVPFIAIWEYVPGACVTVAGETTCEPGYYQQVGGFGGSGGSGVGGGSGGSGGGGGCAFDVSCSPPLGGGTPPKSVL